MVIIDVVDVDLWVTSDGRRNCLIPSRVEDGRSSSRPCERGKDLISSERGTLDCRG